MWWWFKTSYELFFRKINQINKPKKVPALPLEMLPKRSQPGAGFTLTETAGIKNVRRTFVDAYFILTSGAKVNSNPCASALFVQSYGGGVANR